MENSLVLDNLWWKKFKLNMHEATAIYVTFLRTVELLTVKEERGQGSSIKIVQTIHERKL